MKQFVRILGVLTLAAWVGFAADFRLEPYRVYDWPGHNPLPFTFIYTVPVIGMVHVEYSLNLIDWQPAQTYWNDLTNRTRIQVMSYSPIHAGKFYRVRVTPE